MRRPYGGWELGLSPRTINSFRQNSPELVVRDAQALLGLDERECEVLRDILLARGINKWLKARRDIIRLKSDTKAAIKAMLSDYDKTDPAQKATLKLLMQYQRALRRICHQSRWVIWPRIANAAQAERHLTIEGTRA